MAKVQAQGAVVVTGSSSGIGRACALMLDQAGFQVYAGVRKEKDAESLRAAASPRLRPLFIDITDDRMVAEAARRVAGEVGDAGLWGLVNNAGVGFVGPLEYLPLHQIRDEMAINVVGQLAVTQAFLPLIRKARGRIVNIGSIAGRVALPFTGAISMSKHAIEAMSDTLRMELAPWGIHVVLVQPGLIVTEAVEKALPIARRFITEMPEDGKRYFGDFMTRFTDAFVEQNRKGSPPEVIGEVVLKALTASRPSPRYAAGKESSLAMAASKLPDRMVDRIKMKFAGLPTKFGILS